LRVFFVVRSIKAKHIREIDGLRLLAAAAVVSHIAPSVARHYQDVTGVKTYDECRRTN
jgi:peptidoglycan/LPS O-acetylase OafA/YrhL